MKNQTFMATGIIALFLLAGSINTFAQPSGAVAQGDISVYKNGKLADTFTGKNPVVDGALLVCNGQCMIKATGVSLVGSDGAQLAIKNEQGQFNLLLKQGSVDFILTDRVGKMGFYTSDGQYTIADVVFNASTRTPVRGYMQVADGGTKIGVYEGRMVFDTVEGAKTVDSNNYIVLAQADIGTATAGNARAYADNDEWECDAANAGRICDKDEEDWQCDDNNQERKCNNDDVVGAWWSKSDPKALISGTVVLAAVAWGVYEYADDDDDDNNTNGSVETTPPSRSPAGTSPNDRASERATPPARPINSSPSR
jgi:hypothetical protein